MKTKFLLLMLPLCLCGCGSQKEDPVDPPVVGNKNKVIILAGQSNMEGHDSQFNTLPKDTRDKYKGSYDNVKIIYDNMYFGNKVDEFVSVDFGQGVSINHFGPEVGLAYKLGKETPQYNYYFIKSCKGGSCLATDWCENAAVYDQFFTDVDVALDLLINSGISFEISGFMWMQGESDASNMNYAEAYSENELTLINKIKEEYSSYIPSNFSFIDAGISTDDAWLLADDINSAKKETVNSNANYRYVSEGETLAKINSAHYTAGSYLALGEVFGDKYLEVHK